MKVIDYPFSQYYHQYMTIEADTFTEVCKDNIKVNETDCYALCSSYVDEYGEVFFNVLSLGSSWEKCTRGLRRKKMLGTLSLYDVQDCEARIAEPSYEMEEKNEPFLDEKDKDTEEGILKARLDERLDDVRDPYNPDIVAVGILSGQYVMEYEMQIERVKGPFLVGKLIDEPKGGKIHAGDSVYALAYATGEGSRLFGLFSGEHLSEDEQKALETILNETESIGLDFNGISMKN